MPEMALAPKTMAMPCLFAFRSPLDHLWSHRLNDGSDASFGAAVTPSGMGKRHHLPVQNPVPDHQREGNLTTVYAAHLASTRTNKSAVFH